MKKILTLCIVAIFAFSGVEMANADWKNPVTVGDDTINLSSNVQGTYNKSSDNTTYAAATYNKLGTNEYGVASNSSLIKYQKCNTKNKPCSSGTAPTAPTKTDSTAFTGWTDLGK